jgi:hypothetical protein
MKYTYLSLFVLISMNANLLATHSSPKFSATVGKSRHLEVHPIDGDRVSIRLWQNAIGNKTLAQEINETLKLSAPRADIVEFILPAQACRSAETYILHCDDEAFAPTQLNQRVVILRDGSSGNEELVRLEASQLGNQAMRIHLWTDLMERRSLFNPESAISTEKSLTLDIRVWLATGAGTMSWFSVSDLPFRLRY